MALTTEKLRDAHEFLHVFDENDQLAICEVAQKLREAFPLVDDYNLVDYLIENLINIDDEYMGCELATIFQNTIWEGKLED